MRAKGAHHRSGFDSVGQALSSIHKLRGDAWIDSLGKTGTVLREWRAALVADLGGEDTITAQERVIVEAATRTFLLLESVDRYLLALPSLVNKRRKQFFAVVMQRQTLADSLTRNMIQLGLHRRARQIPSLHDYLTAHKPTADTPARPPRAVTATEIDTEPTPSTDKSTGGGETETDVAAS